MNFWILAQRTSDFMDAQEDASPMTIWSLIGFVVVIWFFWKLFECDLDAKSRKF